MMHGSGYHTLLYTSDFLSGGGYARRVVLDGLMSIVVSNLQLARETYFLAFFLGTTEVLHIIPFAPA